MSFTIYLYRCIKILYNQEKQALKEYIEQSERVFYGKKTQKSVVVSIGYNGSTNMHELSTLAMSSLGLLYQAKGRRTPAELFIITGLKDIVAASIYKSSAARNHSKNQNLEGLLNLVEQAKKAVLNNVEKGLDELCSIGLVERKVKQQGKYIAYAIDIEKLAETYVMH